MVVAKVFSGELHMLQFEDLIKFQEHSTVVKQHVINKRSDW